MKRRSWLTGCMLTTCSGWAGLAPRRVLAAITPGQAPEDRTARGFLPLFPLGIVVFPGELIPLHIFEPRYKQLITESADSGLEFGIVTLVPGGASSIGTQMRLDRILRTDDSGNMDVTTRGLRVFELESYQSVVEGKLYPGGQVSFKKNDPRTDAEIQSAIAQMYNQLQYRTGSRKQLAAPYSENLSFLVGHDVGLSQAQELQLLAMPVEYDRQVYLLQHLLRTQ